MLPAMQVLLHVLYRLARQAVRWQTSHTLARAGRCFAPLVWPVGCADILHCLRMLADVLLCLQALADVLHCLRGLLGILHRLQPCRLPVK